MCDKRRLPTAHCTLHTCTPQTCRPQTCRLADSINWHTRRFADLNFCDVNESCEFLSSCLPEARSSLDLPPKWMKVSRFLPCGLYRSSFLTVTSSSRPYNITENINRKIAKLSVFKPSRTFCCIDVVLVLNV